MKEKSKPKVFISYSHDSEEHKQWVEDLASQLDADGISIIFDQKNLPLGYDITKFMEDGLSGSDRVLLICTEKYVQKANAGVGGVGYERSIVTAELVENMGTIKFIPVIRQSTEKPILPKFMGKRLYANLSNMVRDEYREHTEYKKLLHNLNETIQLSMYGNNSSITQIASSGNPSPDISFVPLSHVTSEGKDAKELYEIALEIARRDDPVAWDRLVKGVRIKLPKQLQEWRINRKLEQIRDKTIIPTLLDEAIDLYSSLFAIALAGIISRQDGFCELSIMIDEISQPKEWERSGFTEVTRIPFGMVYAFQSICGAAFLETKRLDLVVKLAQTKIPTGYVASDSLSIINYPSLFLPESLGNNYLKVWSYINTAVQKWPWLNKAFIIEEDYAVALSAYYMALHIHELASKINAGKGDDLLHNKVKLYVPLSFLFNDDDILKKAYRRLCQNKVHLLWETVGVTIDDMKRYWPSWMDHTREWLSRISVFYFRTSSIVHEHILDEYTKS